MATTVVLLFVLVSMICIITLCQTVTVQASTTAAGYEKQKAEITTKFNAVLSILKSAEALVVDTRKTLGSSLVDEYFVDGIGAMMASGEVIRSKNAFVTDTIVNVVNSLPDQGVTFYKNCVEKDVEASNLTKVVVEITQQTQNIAAADAGFKQALAKCKPEDIAECTTKAAAQNALPVLGDNVINTLRVLSEHLKCIEDSADRLRNVGNLVLDSIRRVYPDDLMFMVLPKFDLLDSRKMGQVQSISPPTSRLAQAKSTLNTARKETMEAWDAKRINLTSANSYLAEVFNELNATLGRIPVQAEAAFCLKDAKVALVSNLKAQSSSLLKCVNNIPAPPTDKAVQAVELSLIERELKENLASSTLQCFKKLTNVFYPKEMDCCITEAQDDYSLFVEDVIFSGETLWRKASEYLTWFSRCKINSATAGNKQFIEDAYVFEKCLKMNTKIVVNPPVSNPYVTVNSTTINVNSPN